MKGLPIEGMLRKAVVSNDKEMYCEENKCNAKPLGRAFLDNPPLSPWTVVLVG